MPLMYTSTRSSSSPSAVSSTFATAISSGYAPDSGLYVPQSLPLFSPGDLLAMSGQSYPSLAYSVLRRFIDVGEIPNEDLREITSRTYEKFEFPAEAVTVVQPSSSSSPSSAFPPNAYVAELFNGPTNCFKDLGQLGLVNLLKYFCTKRKRRQTLLVSTTGDTGPAAMRAVAEADCPLLSVIVSYPEGQISSFQRKQMTTIVSPRTHVCSFQGGGDDMDLPIKKMGMDEDFADEHGVCGVNSYNFGRPLMQMVHYFFTYFKIAKLRGVTDFESFRLDVVVPTGAMGNIVAAYISKKCGLPLHFLCASVNDNDITHRTIQKGEFHRCDEMKKTLSDAINIQVPYNMERLLFYLTNSNSNLIASWYESMSAANQKLTIPPEWLAKLQLEFKSARINDEAMCQAMKRTHEKYKYYCDPHTSVAIAGAEELGYFANDNNNNNPVAIMATASPVKFQESVTIALGPEAWEEYKSSPAYPANAKGLELKSETPPTLLERAADQSLEQAQQDWEATVRKIIETKFQVVN